MWNHHFEVYFFEFNIREFGKFHHSTFWGLRIGLPMKELCESTEIPCDFRPGVENTILTRKALG